MIDLIRKGQAPVMNVRKREGLTFLVFPKIEETGVVDHLFTTRLGGVSKGYCAEANFSYSRGDEREAVDENLRRASAALGHGRSLSDFVFTDQTHTDHVLAVTEKDRGKGTERDLTYHDIDGLVTNTPGLILTTLHADCVPLYLVDPVRHAIGMVHSGWRGTAARIGAKAVARMQDLYGSDPGDLVCGIGPSICRDDYEVGEEVAEVFEQGFDVSESQLPVIRKKENGKYLLDLWQANRAVLESAGVKKEQISVTDICTYCNPGVLFSHRRLGKRRGNLAAFLSLREY